MSRAPSLAVPALLACLAMFLGGSGNVSAQAADPGARIVAVAMTDLGAYQGECFTWVRRVVEEATGIPMGYGYRDGFLEGGAVEVPLSEIQAGDVIQVADDTDNGPGADYPGLHTSIVLEPLADGRVRVIDSNSQWDGVVRIRNDYNPLASQAAYPYLTARAYRFTTALDGIVEGSQLSVTPGGTARIDAGGDCLRLRETPGTTGTVIRCVPDGTIVTVLDGTIDADGFTWQQIRAGSDTGWVALIYLQGIGGAPPASTPTPAPSPTAAPTAAPTATPSTPISQTTGTIQGDLPASGGTGLIVWGGGSTIALIASAGGDGCQVRSVWVTVSGSFVGYTNGAPSFVNAGWNAHYPGEIPSFSPIIILCTGGTPTSSPGGSSGSSPSAPVDGEPPGPAGNEN